MTDSEAAELLEHLLCHTDTPNRARVYAYLQAVSQFLQPGSAPDADATLVGDPVQIVDGLESEAGWEEARTSDRDDGLITDLRDLADVVRSKIRQPVSA